MKAPKIRTRKCKSCNLPFTPSNSIVPVCSMRCSIDYTRLLRANKEAKELKDKCSLWKIDTHSKEHKKALQDNINKLARMIDASFGFTCIDCGKEYGKQVDGAHFTSVGSNCSIRYNLHNIHSADSQCNKWSDKHHEGYKLGLVSRYGSDYLSMVEGLPLQYKSIHLSNAEINDKLISVRKLIRDFNSFNLKNGMNARYLFNEIIEIYK